MCYCKFAYLHICVFACLLITRKFSFYIYICIFGKEKKNDSNSNRSKPNKQSNQTKPNQTKPNQTKPNQTKPNQTKPNESKYASKYAYICNYAMLHMSGSVLEATSQKKFECGLASQIK
jgi:hypothetical protein